MVEELTITDHSKNDTEEQKVDRARIVELSQKMHDTLHEALTAITNNLKVCDLYDVNEGMTQDVDLDKYEPEMDKITSELEALIAKYTPDQENN